jgi:hypothetical protein
VLTNQGVSGIIIKLSTRGRRPQTALKKTLKKVEKTFKKGIDKQGRMWYNSRAAAKAVANDP